jgi:hypothetical protein
MAPAGSNGHRARAFLTLGTVAVLAPAPAVGQGSALVHPQPPRTVTVAAGPEYRAGWLHEFVFGRHYRDLWTTPIAVEVLDLAAFAGGLTPLRRGGGAQTRSLRLAGANDHEYVFRSVNKHPLWLPAELRETIAERAVRDQVSLLHPGAALVAAPLLGAAGVLHAQPQLFVMPDDPRLGEYRAEFAGMLGIVEERPREGPNGEGFGGASDVAGTDRLLELVRGRSRDRVDSRAFLAARLLDLYLGDGDRHAAQWRWARFDEADRWVWRPIPRDRDEAFARFDGLLPRLARISHPDLVGFGYDYGSVYGLSWRAEDLDRLLLSDLERPVWDSTVRAIQVRLTDSVIDGAVRRLPPEYYRSNGAELARALKRRREGLPGAAHDLYALLARDVDIRLTAEPELVAVERLADGRVSVRVFRRDPARGPASVPYFARTFDRAESNEIRLYLAGRDDSVVVSGQAVRSILVRVIADSAGGSAVLVDSSRVTGGGRLTRVYDGGRAAVRVVPGPTTSVDRRSFGPQPRPDVFHAQPRDHGDAWMPGAWVSFQPDVGVIVAGGATLRTYGFRRFPYRSSMSFRLAFATGAGKFGAEYTADFRTTTAARFALRARWSGFDVVRFYGLGNETAFSGSTDFYKVKQQQYLVAPSLVVPLGPSLELSAGPVVKYAHTTLEPGTLVYALRPYGIGSWGQVGVHAGLRFDTRDPAVAATRGVLLTVAGAAYPAFWDVTAPFQEVHGEAATYLTAAIPTRPTLALRLAGKKVWGPFPFQEAAFVGGLATVRGYSEHRFAGSAGVYANAELRFRLTRLTLVLPGAFGVFGLADVGRVYVSGEPSDRWHAAAGGGIWFAPLSATNTVSLAVARSPERTATYLRLGFAF